MKAVWVVLVLAAAGCSFDTSGAGAGGDAGARTDGGGAPDDGAPGGDGDPGPGEGVEVVSIDPFADGTAFAYVIGHAGDVYLGPSRDGDALVRPDPDTSVALSFAADVIGNSSSNGGTAPYGGIGYTGCTEDDDCGPDNEDGRGLFAAGTFGAEDILVAGGARSAGDLDYLYVTRDTGTSLSFKYIDLSALLGGSTKGFSAMLVTTDRIYVGFPDTGGARPYLLAIETLPTTLDGLDAVEDLDAFDLDADNMPGLKTGGTAIIDALVQFADRLYLANSGAWVRSTVASPDGYATSPDDWSVITPSSSDYDDKTSRTNARTADLEPADRAVPAFAVHGGRLYAARNTTEGPQLWVCDPAEAAPDADCDADDWTLIATNVSGDTQLSQMSDSQSRSIGLLVSTGDHLYVGYDNPGGVRIFRTAEASPSTAADFEQVGNDGLGDATTTRIFDGKALGVAGDTLYLVVGDAVGPVRVLRVPPP